MDRHRRGGRDDPIATRAQVNVIATGRDAPAAAHRRRRHGDRDAHREARVRQRDRGEEGHRLLSAHPPELRCLGTAGLPALVWQLDRPCRAVASTVLGGGVGPRRWVVNVQVPNDYERTDPWQHLVELAEAAGCDGPGVGFLTAARIDRFTTGTDECVEAYATVGLQRPVWAAAPDAHEHTHGRERSTSSSSPPSRSRTRPW